jgi:predicted peroxiredoxin
MTEKYLVNCEHGTTDPEKATISFILAFTSSKTNETAVFATSDASHLFGKNNRPDIVADGYEPLNGLIDGFIENGGKIWLCPACAKAKGIVQEDLLDGVEIAGAPKTMAFLASGGKTLA